MIDLIILIFVALFALKGSIKGFVTEAVGILGIILALLFSYITYPHLLKIVQNIKMSDVLATYIAHILSFLLIYMIVIILGHIVSSALSAISLGWLNRVIGFIFGIFKGLVIASIILWGIVSILPKDNELHKNIKSSNVANTTMSVLPYLYDRIKAITGSESVDSILNKI